MFELLEGLKAKLMVAVLAVVLVGAVGLYWYVGSIRSDNAKLKDQAAALTTELAAVKHAIAVEKEVLASRDQALAKQKSKSSKTRKGVEAAVKAAPAWADTPVPTELSDALRR